MGDRAVILAVVIRLCALIAAAVLAGCGSADDWSNPRPAPGAIGVLGPGFFDPEHPPAPEATLTPRPGSWDGVHPSKGYRVVLLSAGDGAETRTVVDAVRRWADEEHVSLKTLAAGEPVQHVPSIVRAIRLKPDLIITAGNDLIDALALMTASHLDQQFLIVGAEIAEPTANVTAADWTGTGFRGQGLGTPSVYDHASFTPERVGRAVRAGVAAVLHGLTGIVVRVR